MALPLLRGGGAGVLEPVLGDVDADDLRARRASRRASPPPPVPTRATVPRVPPPAAWRARRARGVALVIITSPRATGCRRSRLLLRQRRELVPTRQGSGKTCWIEAAEHLDGRALRADDSVADHAGDDLVVPDPPGGSPARPARSVPRRAGTAPRARGPARRRRRARPRSRRAWNACPSAGRRGARASRRVEAAAVAEHLADLLVLPRRHMLEHVQLLGGVAKAEASPAAARPQRRRDRRVLQVRGRGLGVVSRRA